MRGLFDAILHAGDKSERSKAMRAQLLTTKLFQVENSCLDQIVQLGKQPWRDWIAQVVPPFPLTWVQWSPRALLGHPDVQVLDPNADRNDIATEMGALITDGIVTLIVQGPQGRPVMVPFGGSLNAAGFAPHNEYSFIHECAWGINYHKTFGSYPPFLVATDQRRTDLDIARLAIDERAQMEFSGAFRMVAATLAVINTPRAVELVEGAGKSSTMLDGAIRPYPKRQLVVIRPDAVRHVVRAARASNTPPTPKREHDVRSHLRRLRSGKVSVVRAHRRGDAELGTVRTEYIVEREPKLNDEQAAAYHGDIDGDANL